MLEGEIPCRQPISPEPDQRSGNHGKIRDPHSQEIDPSQEAPGSDPPQRAQLLESLPLALASHQGILVVAGDEILHQPQEEADPREDGSQHCRLAERDGGDGRVPVDMGGEHVEADPPAQGIRGAVFGNGLHEYQQSPDGVVPGEEGQEDLPQPQARPGPIHRPSFLQGRRETEHGILQQDHQEGEDMEAHDQDQSPQGEECRDPIGKHRKELGEQSPFLHEEDPSHRSDVRRRHKRDQEQHIQPAFPGQFRPGQEVGRRHPQHRGPQHHQNAQHQGIDDHPSVPRFCQGFLGIRKSKAIIDDDRLYKYISQRGSDQQDQDCRQS